MVPDIAAKGHSFKGAFAYYLHDKRQDVTAAHPQTAERVAWTETRNLATDDPETAKRIMLATARQADELKKAAGIKATGRKSNAHVYAYSLAWHPDEAGQLDRAEMSRAVDASLKALGADHLQAVIVCHRDQKHPHVHVVLNRVDPATGKMHSFSNDKYQLSDWANAYERERGQILTPKREEKREKREQIRAEFQKTATPAPAQTQGQAQRPERKPSEAAMLKELSDAQKARHKEEWQALGLRNKAARDKVYADSQRTIAEHIESHKRVTKPAWAAFFRASRESEKAFHARERSIIGILHNALAATPIGQRGSLSAVFRNVISAPSRETAFRGAQEASRGAFSREIKSGLDANIATLKQQRANALAGLRQQYAKDRAGLIERQDGEKAKMREAWRQVYERRGKDPRYQARQNAARAMEQKPMRGEFDKARELAAAKQPAPYPHNKQSLSVPSPAPAPAGMPTPPARKVQDVPEMSRSVEVNRDAPAPTPQQDFGKTAEKPMSRADFWNQKAKEQAAEPTRDRNRDRDFDRER